MKRQQTLATAHEQGDVMVRFGATAVIPDDGGKPDGVWADDNTQLGLSLTYMLSPAIGIELLGATPFKHDIMVKGVGKAGTTKHLPPTVSAQYFFNNASAVTPYVGVGANYTVFFDENLKNLGINSIELKDSFGLALQAGADIAINPQWGLGFNIRKIYIDTEVKGATINVDIDPMVYSLMATYRF